MKNRDYKKIIEHFGEDNQLGKTLEELTELIAEVVNFSRHRANKKELTEEIADVYNVLEQLKIITGIDDDDIEFTRNYKNARTLDRMRNN